MRSKSVSKVPRLMTKILLSAVTASWCTDSRLYVAKGIEFAAK